MVVQFIINGIISGSAYILVAIGMALVFGILNIINIAHGVFYAVGAYMFYTWANLMHIDPAPSTVLAVAALALFAIIAERLIYKPLRKRDHTMQIIASNGFALMIAELIRTIWTGDTLRISSPFMGMFVKIGSISISVQRLLVVIVAAVTLTLVLLLMKKTKLGLMMRALPQNDVAAKLNGININMVSGVTFAIATGLAALGAAVAGPIFTVQPMMGDALGNMAFAAVIVGGIGSIEGAAIAALGMGLVEAFVSGYIATGYENLITFTILILILIFRPTGLLGKKQ